MKKALCIILCFVFVLALGCSSGRARVSDGRARPSNSGKLQVIDGKLCSKDGKPVTLRGVSAYGISMADSFVNQQLFHELANDAGVNIFRMPLYTWGVGVVGYCTGGDQAFLKQVIDNGVEYGRKEDMYVIIDWHILEDGDPNRYVEESKVFFDEMSKKYAKYDHVLYEICNEPNHCTWADVKQYAEQVIPVIRANDPKAVILVGTPEWSQRVDEAAADPLPFDNLMYSLHFYAASHKAELRDMAEGVSQAGLPIFVTEYGITANTGSYPRDPEEAEIWLDMLEREGISYCMWSFSKVPEACSAIASMCSKYNGFTNDDYTPTGKWLMETLQKRTGMGITR